MNCTFSFEISFNLSLPIESLVGNYVGNECTINAEESSGKVIFIDNSTEYLKGNIIGPSQGKPVTFIFTKTIKINAKITGNVRIFTSADFTFDNQAATGLIMFMSNGKMEIIGSINKGFLSSDKNIIIANQAFYGQHHFLNPKYNSYLLPN